MTSGEHVLTVSTFVPRPRAEVFAFFSDAANLEEITPVRLHFQMITPTPVQMSAGILIDYRLQLFGLPFYWRTRIREWQPDVRFVDEQLKGPYASWVHTHAFEDANGGTRMTDTVRYKLPLFPFGEIALPIVRLQLKYIFDYRTWKIQSLMGSIPD
jgi:ligand-binding SRPBCC domain-containing protein